MYSGFLFKIKQINNSGFRNSAFLNNLGGKIERSGKMFAAIGARRAADLPGEQRHGGVGGVVVIGVAGVAGVVDGQQQSLLRPRYQHPNGQLPHPPHESLVIPLLPVHFRFTSGSGCHIRNTIVKFHESD